MFGVRADYDNSITGGMSEVLAKTIKMKSTDDIFVEVHHTENLGLSMPEQLRLFHLALRSNKFYSGDLETMLYRNIGRYVFSRAKLEDYRLEGDLDSIIVNHQYLRRDSICPIQSKSKTAITSQAVK
jgi:hypothetical protein